MAARIHISVVQPEAAHDHVAEVHDLDRGGRTAASASVINHVTSSEAQSLSSVLTRPPPSLHLSHMK